MTINMCVCVCVCTVIQNLCFCVCKSIICSIFWIKISKKDWTYVKWFVELCINIIPMFPKMFNPIQTRSLIHSYGLLQLVAGQFRDLCPLTSRGQSVLLWPVARASHQANANVSHTQTLLGRFIFLLIHFFIRPSERRNLRKTSTKNIQRISRMAEITVIFFYVVSARQKGPGLGPGGPEGGRLLWLPVSHQTSSALTPQPPFLGAVWPWGPRLPHTQPVAFCTTSPINGVWGRLGRVRELCVFLHTHQTSDCVRYTSSKM